MALLGMKETAAAARWANVGALGILRLHEEFVRFPPTSDGGLLTSSHTHRTRPSSARCDAAYSGLSLVVIKPWRLSTLRQSASILMKWILSYL